MRLRLQKERDGKEDNPIPTRCIEDEGGADLPGRYMSSPTGHDKPGCILIDKQLTLPWGFAASFQWVKLA